MIPVLGHYIFANKYNSINVIKLNSIAHTQTAQINTLRSEQNGCRFEDIISKCIFLTEKFYNWIPISLNFVHRGLIDNNQAVWFK